MFYMDIAVSEELICDVTEGIFIIAKLPFLFVHFLHYTAYIPALTPQTPEVLSVRINSEVEEKERMPRWLEVHHKWWRWCNTVNGIKSVCRAKHQHFHLFMNSKKSHQKGVMIWDSQSMEAWLKVIIQWDQYLRNVNM